MNTSKTLPFLLLLLLSTTFVSGHNADDDDRRTYIISVKHPEDVHLVHTPDLMKEWYVSLLEKSGESAEIIHAYTHAMTGFSARLTDRQLAAYSKSDWFLAAYPERQYTLHTTHTPDFLGITLRSTDGVWNNSNLGDGIIIGIVDTGITSGHPSFDDRGMPPPPKRWKGACEAPIVCNNKLIGARSLIAGLDPSDEAGHGTHTASTAAGAFVPNASVFGNAAGTAAGMAPRAHVAAYKVCTETCASTDIVAGIGAAIRDGCDIISLSLGPTDWVPFHEDPVSIGSFSAIRRGIFVSASAGNEGPDFGSLRNENPWVITVAASTMDRDIGATVKLGNGVELEGQSLYQVRNFSSQMYPLVFAGDAPNNTSAMYCEGDGAFDGFDVRGKIVLCQRGGNTSRIQKGDFVKAAGAAGMVLMNQDFHGQSTMADPHKIPASHVGYADGISIRDYINSGSNPTATIVFIGTVIGTARAPVISSFSSRGPNIASPGILKPDITAPGVNVLAGWFTNVEPNRTGPAFNIISGTSMACPHVSGLAALIKVAHPDWSPSAIKSAIMTTAYTHDNKGDPISDERSVAADYFAVGAGHINITSAVDPGLVYSIRTKSYLHYLCGLGYTSEQVTSIANCTEVCSKLKHITEAQLNYPSISVTLGPDAANFTVTRMVTNVGVPSSVFDADIEMPAGVSAVVRPKQLVFRKLHQRKKFKVTFTATTTTARGGSDVGFAEGQLRWVSKRHVVRSPISIKING